MDNLLTLWVYELGKHKAFFLRVFTMTLEHDTRHCTDNPQATVMHRIYPTIIFNTFMGKKAYIL